MIDKNKVESVNIYGGSSPNAGFLNPNSISVKTLIQQMNDRGLTQTLSIMHVQPTATGQFNYCVYYNFKIENDNLYLIEITGYAQFGGAGVVSIKYKPYYE